MSRPGMVKSVQTRTAGNIPPEWRLEERVHAAIIMDNFLSEIISYTDRRNRRIGHMFLKVPPQRRYSQYYKVIRVFCCFITWILSFTLPTNSQYKAFFSFFFLSLITKMFDLSEFVLRSRLKGEWFRKSFHNSIVHTSQTWLFGLFSWLHLYIFYLFL